MSDEYDILAGEYALGLLSPEEASVVEAQLAVDASLSARVAWWRGHLAGLVEQGVAPSSTVWTRIEARLSANDNPVVVEEPVVRRALGRWRAATAGVTAIAAALLGVIALRPPAVAPPTPKLAPAAPLVASLAGEGGTAVAVAFDARDNRLFVTPVTLRAGKGDAELWVIPDGQSTPVSLGVVGASGATSRAISSRQAALLAVGATFAISQEASGGSTTGSPQGPIVATGKINRV